MGWHCNVCALCPAWLTTEFQAAQASSDGSFKDQQDATVGRKWLRSAWSSSPTLQLEDIFSYSLFTAEIRTFIVFEPKRWEVELVYYSFSAPVNLRFSMTQHYTFCNTPVLDQCSPSKASQVSVFTEPRLLPLGENQHFASHVVFFMRANEL